MTRINWLYRFPKTKKNIDTGSFEYDMSATCIGIYGTGISGKFFPEYGYHEWKNCAQEF